MYKKIKNGSFMNWIWFIVTMLPLIFITCDYISNNSKYIEGKKIDNYIIYRDMILTEEGTNIYEWKNDYFVIGNEEIVLNHTFSENTTNSWYITSENYDNFLTLCYFIRGLDIPDNHSNINIYFRLRGVDNSSCLYYYVFDYDDDNSDYTSSIYSTNEWVMAVEDFTDFNNDILTFYIKMMNTSVGKTHFFFDIFICQTEVNLESTDNLFYKYTNAYYDLLRTIQTNGFISNAFLNLAQFFGVNNVYYSLACYYIEYLLVIVLLHLAFDVLYMLPNICHKFMEKIGGERD